MPRSLHKILVVDDEADMLATVGLLLRRAAYTTVELNSPTQALALSFEELESFDLLMTDFHMPHFDGIQLATQLVERHPKLKVVVMSGIPWVEDSAREAGYAFLSKPFSYTDLMDLLRRMLCAAA
jgi:two-component system response regulator GlrR